MFERVNGATINPNASRCEVAAMLWLMKVAGWPAKGDEIPSGAKSAIHMPYNAIPSFNFKDEKLSFASKMIIYIVERRSKFAAVLEHAYIDEIEAIDKAYIAHTTGNYRLASEYEEGVFDEPCATLDRKLYETVRSNIWNMKDVQMRKMEFETRAIYNGYDVLYVTPSLKLQPLVFQSVVVKVDTRHITIPKEVLYFLGIFQSKKQIR